MLGDNKSEIMSTTIPSSCGGAISRISSNFKPCIKEPSPFPKTRTRIPWK
jgi:hypothetical protein